MLICTIEGCVNHVKAKGLCSKHHQQWYRATHRKHKEMVRRKACSIVGCEKLASTTDYYCRNHQRKFELYGDPFGGRIVHKLCTIEGCTNPHRARGLCRNHYYKLVTIKKSKKTLENMDNRLVEINRMIQDPVWTDLLKLYNEKKLEAATTN